MFRYMEKSKIPEFLLSLPLQPFFRDSSKAFPLPSTPEGREEGLLQGALPSASSVTRTQVHLGAFFRGACSVMPRHVSRILLSLGARAYGPVLQPAPIARGNLASIHPSIRPSIDRSNAASFHRRVRAAERSPPPPLFTIRALLNITAYYVTFDNGYDAR